MLIFDPQGLLSCAHLTNLFLEAFKSGGAITLYLLSPLWSFSPSSPIPCFFKKKLEVNFLGTLLDAALGAYWFRTGSALFSIFWDSCVPKRVRPSGFCCSMAGVICVFLLSDVPFIFPCFLLILCWFGAWEWRVKGNSYWQCFPPNYHSSYLKWN